MWLVSVLCLFTVAMTCITGVLSEHYKDNYAQQWGMFLVCFGAISIATRIWRLEYVSPDAPIAHIGMALYAVGTFYKQWRQVREAKPAVSRAIGAQQ